MLGAPTALVPPGINHLYKAAERQEVSYALLTQNEYHCKPNSALLDKGIVQQAWDTCWKTLMEHSSNN